MKSWDIFYMRPDYFTKGGIGYNYCKRSNCLPNPMALGNTHIYLKMVEAESLNDIFKMMQAENWSPNGEARELIQSRGLRHTSMSVGDVIVSSEGEVWMVDSIGFKKLNS